MDLEDISRKLDLVLDALERQSDAPAAITQGGLEKFRTVEWISGYLGLSKKTVYARVQDGSLPHYKFGKRLYFLESELHALISQGKGEEEIKDFSGHPAGGHH